ncbi:hypothetical protein D3C81_1741160 [compost metagenome]
MAVKKSLNTAGRITANPAVSTIRTIFPSEMLKTARSGRSVTIVVGNKRYLLPERYLSSSAAAWRISIEIPSRRFFNSFNTSGSIRVSSYIMAILVFDL